MIKRAHFSEKALIIFMLFIGLLGIGVMLYGFGALDFSSSITGRVTEETVNQPPVFIETGLVATQGTPLSIDLAQYFSDPEDDALTFLAGEEDQISVAISGSILTLTPAPGFVGERTLTIVASDGVNVVRVPVRVSVTAAESTPVQEPGFDTQVEFTTAVAPTAAQVILNTTNPATNDTNQNLTVFIINATDADGDPVRNITDWRRNSLSIALLNMPFETNSSNLSTGAIRSYTTYGFNGTLGTGTAANVPVWNLSGQVGGAYIFDGTNDHLNLPSSSILNVPAGSVEAWANLKQEPTTGAIRVFTFVSTVPAAETFGWKFEYFLNTTQKQISFRKWTPQVDVAANAALPLNAWSHIVVTWSGTNTTIYMNGTQIGTTAQASPTSGTGIACIGGDSRASCVSAQNWNGTLDEVRVYNRTLTSEEVFSLYVAGNASRHPTIIHSDATTAGEVWSVAVTPNDNQPNTDGNTTLSNNVTILSTVPPSIAQVILNTTNPLTNDTNQNLTAFIINATDADGQPVRNITDWRRNNRSIAVLNMPFETNSSNVSAGAIRDYSTFGNNGTLGGGAAANASLWIRSGLGGGAYVFDGVNDYIDVGSSATLSFGSGNFTYELWVNASPTQSSSPRVLAQDSDATNFKAFIIDGTTKRMEFWCRDPDGDTLRTMSNSSINDSARHHIVGTRSGTTAFLYIDGVLHNTSTNAAVGSCDASTSTRIGGRTGGGLLPFNGTIDAVRIYNHSLSAAQVSQIYLEENVSRHYATIHADETQTGEVWNVAVTPNDNQPNTDGATVLSNNVTIQQVVQLNVTPTIAQVILNTTNPATNDTNQNLTVFIINATDADGQPVRNITDWRRNNLSIAVLNMPFETNVTSTAANATRDYSTFANNGTLTVAPTWNSSGKMGGHYVFDGTDDRINISDHPSLDGFSQATWEMWVKPTTVTALGTLFNKRGSFDSDNAYIALFTGGGSTCVTGTLCFETSTTGTNFFDNVINATTAFTLNDWNHLAITFNSSSIPNVNFYVNGILRNKTTQQDQNASIFNSAKELLIGVANSNSPVGFFNGSIDEFRIYNRTLSFEQIRQLFLEGNASKHLTTIVHNETEVGEVWSVAVTPNDNQPNTDGTTVLSNNVTIQQAVQVNNTPTIAQVILNTTNPATNDTNQNLTVFIINATDADGQPVRNITDWRRNNLSIALLNMPFETNVTSTAVKAVRDYSVFNNNGTLGNGTAASAPIWNLSGRVGGAYVFDGINDFIAIQDNGTQRPPSVSVAAWIKTTQTSSGRIICKPIIAATDQGYCLGSSVTIAGRAEIRTGRPVARFATSNATVNDGNWHHVVGTIDNTGLRIYVDGNLSGVNQITGFITYDNNLELQIGRFDAVGEYFNGTIDEAMIFNDTLSSEQILQLYRESNASRHLRTIVSQETIPGEIWQVAVTPNDNQPNTDGTTVLSNNVTIINNAPVIAQAILNTTNPLTNDTNQNLTLFIINVTDAQNDTVQNITDWRRNGTSIAVLNMPFETDVSSAAARAIRDYSTFENNGTLGNGTATSIPLWNLSGRVGGAYIFDGIGDMINISSTAGDELDLIQQGTIEFWLRTTTIENDVVLEKSDDNTHYLFQTGTAGTCGVGFIFFATGAGAANRVCSTSAINDSVFHHVVGTFNGTGTSTLRLYVDGTLVGTTSGASNPVSNSKPLQIGSRGGSVGFTGVMDEIHIYNRTLSAEQVLANFRAGNASRQLTTIVAQETEVGEIWSVAVTPNDNQPNTDGNTTLSNNVTIQQVSANLAPTIAQVILNTTNPATNDTNQNLTVFIINATDADGQPVRNITDWRRNNRSIAVLNMPFETNSSNTSIGALKDYSTFANNGTLGNGTPNAPTWNLSGQVGGAYLYDGINDFMNITGTTASLNNFGTAISVEAWFYARSTPAVGSGISKANPPDSAANTTFLLHPNGSDGGWRMSWFLSDGTNFFGVGPFGFGLGPVLTFNNWTHIVGTFNGTTMILYINGTPVLNVSNSTFNINDVGHIHIGHDARYAIGTRHWNGSIDSFRIYNFTLSPEQVKMNFLHESVGRNIDTIVSPETEPGEVWSVAVTPNDNQPNTDGTTVLSNNVTIQQVAAVITNITTCPAVVNGTVNVTQNLVSNGSCITINASNVVLTCNGFSIAGNGSGFGIKLTGLNNVTIAGCVFSNFMIDVFADPTNLTIENSSFENSTIGLDVFNTTFSRVRNNVFRNNTIALLVNLSRDNNFTNNTFANNTISLWVQDSLNNTFNETFLPPNVLLENTSSSGGRINYTQSVNITTTITLSRFVSIRNNKVFVNSTAASALNRSAELTLRNIAFLDPRPSVDFRDNGTFIICPGTICTELSFSSGVFIFNVTQFTTYSTNESSLNVSLTKRDSSDPVNVSRFLNYTIIVNVTLNDASNVTLTDQYPPQVVFNASQPAPVSGTNNTFVLGNLTEGQAIVTNITVFVLPVANNTIINNTANITFQNSTGSIFTLNVTENTTVLNQLLVRIAKNDTPDPVVAGEILNYSIIVNTTLGDSYNITLTDIYPNQTIFVSSQPPAVSGTNNTFIIGNLTADTAFVTNISLQVASVPNGTRINNSANISFQNVNSAIFNASTTQNTTVITGVAGCLTINTSTTLVQGISSVGSCITFGADNIELNCAGFTITYGTGSADDKVGVNITNRENDTVRNCVIVKGSSSGSRSYGVLIANGTGARIENNTIRTNGTDSNDGVHIASGGISRTVAVKNLGDLNNPFCTNASGVGTCNTCFASTPGVDCAFLGQTACTDGSNFKTETVLRFNTTTAPIGGSLQVIAGEYGDCTLNGNLIAGIAVDNACGAFFAATIPATAFVVGENNLTCTIFGAGTDHDNGFKLTSFIYDAPDSGPLNVTVKANNIVASGGNESNGIYMLATNARIEQNVINTTGDRLGHGIFLDGVGRTNTVFANRINVTARNANGINVVNSSSNVFLNNTILTATQAAVRLERALNNNFTNSTVPFSVFNSLLVEEDNGRINYSQAIGFTNSTNLAQFSAVRANAIFVNATHPLGRQLNRSAILTFYGINNPLAARPQVDLEDDGTAGLCSSPRCTNFLYNKSGATVTYTVASFTTYSTTNASDCGILDLQLNESEHTFVMDANLNATGTCFTVIADNITLDCAGHTINYSTRVQGNAVFAQDVSNFTMRNCVLLVGNSSRLPIADSPAILFTNTTDNRTTRIDGSTFQIVNFFNQQSARKGVCRDLVLNTSTFTFGNTSCDNVTIRPGMTITINNAGAKNETVRLDTVRFTFTNGTTITADATGFTADRGPGAGISSAGGAHGGVTSISVFYGQGLTPITVGSGGASGFSSTAGSGGGAIAITAVHAIINGTITVTGGGGGGSGAGAASGGGAGGSIFITADILEGNASLLANGGGGGTTGAFPASGGGGGAGGRIMLAFNTSTFTRENAQVIGGANGGGFFQPTRPQNGTIAFHDRDNDTLTIGYSWRWQGNDRGVWNFTTINVSDSVQIRTNDSTLNFSVRHFFTQNVTMDVESIVYNLSLNASEIRIESTTFNNIRKANITTSNFTFISGTFSQGSLGYSGGLGSAGAQGPGNSTGGGAHCGPGAGGSPSSAFYDSPLNPQDLGSGGGSGSGLSAGDISGGAGGGVFFLTGLQRVSINGTISVNGGGGGSTGVVGGLGAAGGAGGTINIRAGIFEGSGSLSATGGSGGSGNPTAGAGAGGGCIIVRFNSSTFPFNNALVTNGATGGSVGGGTGKNGTLGFIDLDDDILYTYQSWRFQASDLAVWNFTTINLTNTGDGRTNESSLNFSVQNFFMHSSRIFPETLGRFNFTIKATGTMIVENFSGINSMSILDVNATNIIINGSSSIAGVHLVNVTATNVSLSTTSTISTDTNGFPGGSSGSGNGSGPGGGLADGGGGGHGGRGGGGNGGSFYDSSMNPILFGSGGGGATVGGGAGGGAILIRSAAYVSINGTLTSSAAGGSSTGTGTGGGGGGGSGGTINILTNVFEGVGVLRASGADGGVGSPAGTGEGGSGGRIFVRFNSSTFNITQASVTGGCTTGGFCEVGQNGTIGFLDVDDAALSLHQGWRWQPDDQPFNFTNVTASTINGTIIRSNGSVIRVSDTFFARGSVWIVDDNITTLNATRFHMQNGTISAGARLILIYSTLFEDFNTTYAAGSSLSLENRSVARVDWTTAFPATVGNLSRRTGLGFNRIFVNSTGNAGLNTTANLTFFNITFIDPRPIFDNEDDGSFALCPTTRCTEIRYSNNIFVENVSRFTTYSLFEAGNVTIVLVKSDNPDPVGTSKFLNYTIVINVTAGAANNISLTDTYPSLVIFQNASPTPIAGTNNTFIIGNVSEPDVVRVNITVFVINTTATLINNTVNLTFQNGSGDILMLNVTENTTVNAAPTVGQVILNTTNPLLNDTFQNLTLFIFNTSDANDMPVHNITDWRRNNVSIAVLNMPFESNISFTNGSGLIRDYSTVGNNGTLGGSNPLGIPRWNLSGRVGGAYIFDGINDSIPLPEPPNNSTNVRNGSVFAWIKTSNPGSSFRGIVVKQLAYGMFIRDGLFVIFDWSAGVERSTGVNLSDGLYHFVGFTFRSNVTSGTRLYIDGTLNLTTTLNVSSQSEGVIIGAGDNPGTTQFFNGTIDEVMIFNRTLSDEQVRQLFIEGNATRRHLRTLVHQETEAGEVWQVAVTPNDNEPNTDGETIFSNTVTIVGNTFTNVSIVKTDFPDPITVSSFLNYTINVSSTGNGTATDVTVNETYPSQVIFISASPAPVAGTNHSFLLGSLTPGQNVSINITVLVRNFTSTIVINNTANVTFRNESNEVQSRVATANTTVFPAFTAISTCPFVINTPGAYALNQSITATCTCLEIRTSHVDLTCSGFNVTYATGGGSGCVGINISNASIPIANITVRECNIRKTSASGFGGTGIIGRNASNVRFTNNTIRTNGTSNNEGIRFDTNSNSHRIENNTIVPGGSSFGNTAVLYRISNGTTITGNNITTTGTQNNFAVYLTFSRNNTIANNLLRTSPTTFSNAAVLFENVTHTSISNNRILTNGTSFNTAVLFTSGSSNNITYNTIIGNGNESDNEGIQLELASNNNLILNNNITTNGSAGNEGILIELNSTNNTIANNTILARDSGGGFNPGIHLFSNVTRTFIADNNITTNGSSVNPGIWMEFDVHNSTVINNIIRTFGTSSFNIGIELSESVKDNTVANNDIRTNGTNNNEGIRLETTASGNRIENNTIRTTGSSSANVGIFILIGAGNNTVANNDIITNGTTNDFGIRIDTNSDNNLIKNNTIITGGSAGVNPGFFLGTNVIGNVITNNSIATSGTSANDGFRAQTGVRNNIMANNTIRTSGTSNLNRGFNFLNNVSHNSIHGNTIITNGTENNYGILMRSDSHNNTAIDNVIITDGTQASHGIRLENITYNNTFIGNNITTKGNQSFAILLFNANSTVFNNTILFNPAEWINSTGTNLNNNFTNTTFEHPNASARFFGRFVLNGTHEITKARLNMTFNRVFLNSSNVTPLNTSAILTFRAITSIDPTPIRDFEDDGSFDVCSPPSCVELGYSGNVFVYNVTSFTTYSSTDVAPNVTIRKSDFPDPVNVSRGLNYTLIVNNTGPGEIVNATVNDTYPPQVFFQSASPTPVSGTNNTFFLGNLTAPSAVLINISVFVLNISNGTLINNTANLTFQNLTGGVFSTSATESTTVLNPPMLNFSNISVIKADFPDPVNASSNLSYTITVSSTGNGTAHNVTVNDTYPSQVIFLNASPTPVSGTNDTFVLGNLTNGVTITINITVLVRNVSNGTILNNIANVTFNNETGAVLRTADTETTTVLAPIFNTSNVSITKTDNPDPVNVNTNLTYQINVSSTDNGTAFNVTVNDTYPNQIIFLAASPAPVSGTNHSFLLGSLTPGQNVSINITVLVRNITNNTVINNTANVTFQNETGALFNASATQSTTVLNNPVFNFTNISVSKSDSPDPVENGTTLSYTITVSSTGNGTAFNVTVNDTYPAQVIFSSASPSPLSGTNNTFILGNLTAGQTVIMNITVTVGQVTNGTIINNTANATFRNETGALLSVFDTEQTTVENVSVAPPVPPAAVGGGGGGGGRRGVDVTPVEVPAQVCFENWACEGWSACVSGIQTRTCTDTSNCNTTQYLPATQQACVQTEQPAQIALSPLQPKIDLFKVSLLLIVFLVLGIILLTLAYVRTHVQTGMPHYRAPRPAPVRPPVQVFRQHPIKGIQRKFYGKVDKIDKLLARLDQGKLPAALKPKLPERRELREEPEIKLPTLPPIRIKRKDFYKRLDRLDTRLDTFDRVKHPVHVEKPMPMQPVKPIKHKPGLFQRIFAKPHVKAPMHTLPEIRPVKLPTLQDIKASVLETRKLKGKSRFYGKLDRLDRALEHPKPVHVKKPEPMTLEPVRITPIHVKPVKIERKPGIFQRIFAKKPKQQVKTPAPKPSIKQVRLPTLQEIKAKAGEKQLTKTHDFYRKLDKLDRALDHVKRPHVKKPEPMTLEPVHIKPVKIQPKKPGIFQRIFAKKPKTPGAKQVVIAVPKPETRFHPAADKGRFYGKLGRIEKRLAELKQKHTHVQPEPQTLPKTRPAPEIKPVTIKLEEKNFVLRLPKDRAGFTRKVSAIDKKLAMIDRGRLADGKKPHAAQQAPIAASKERLPAKPVPKVVPKKIKPVNLPTLQDVKKQALAMKSKLPKESARFKSKLDRLDKKLERVGKRKRQR